MEFAFLDESGDPGKDGSNHLVLTLMCTSDKKEISSIIKEAKSRLRESNKGLKFLDKTNGELKFHSFPDKVLLKRVLKKLSKLKITIYSITIVKNKQKIESTTKQIILHRLFNHISNPSNKQMSIKIIADDNFFNKQETNRFLLETFKSIPIKLKEDNEEESKESWEVAYRNLSKEEYIELKKDQKNLLVEIEHQNSKNIEGLRALDLICGSIYCFFEHKNEEYFECLKEGILKIDGVIMENKNIQYRRK